MPGPVFEASESPRHAERKSPVDRLPHGVSSRMVLKESATRANLSRRPSTPTPPKTATNESDNDAGPPQKRNLASGPANVYPPFPNDPKWLSLLAVNNFVVNTCINHTAKSKKKRRIIFTQLTIFTHNKNGSIRNR